MNAKQKVAKYGVVRDRTIGGRPQFDVVMLGRATDNDDLTPWHWPRFMVRYQRDGKFEREQFDRAINPDDIFVELDTAEAACSEMREAAKENRA